MPPQDPNIFSRNPKTTIIGIFCVFAILAVGFDVLAAKIHYSLFKDRSDKYVRVLYPPFHHGLGVYKEQQASFGGRTYTFMTNSLGLRDSSNRHVPLAKNGKRRILFIGDSFTEAPGIPYEATFVGIIDRALSERGIEVLNAGTASYSGAIYWRKIKYLIEEVGLEIDEVVVFLDISDVYDATTYSIDRHGNVVKSRLLKRFQELIETNTVLLRRVSKALYKQYAVWAYWNDAEKSERRREGLTRVPAGNLSADEPPNGPSFRTEHHHALWTIREEYFEQWGRLGLARETRNLEKLHELLMSRGIKLTIAVYPWPDQIKHKDLNSLQVQHWKAWSEANGVKFVNYFPYFIDERGDRSWEEVLDQLYLEGDVHWNENGHAFVARKFLELLEAP